MIVRLAVAEDVDQIQRLYNNAKNSQWLGGFAFRDPILSKVMGESLIVAELVFEGVVGASEVGYIGTQGMKMSLVAVTPDLYRRRIGTSIYTAWAMVASLQGRLFMEDHFIGD